MENENYKVSGKPVNQMCYRELMEEYGSISGRLMQKTNAGWFEAALESRRNCIAAHVCDVVFEAFQMGIGPEAMGAAGVFPIREFKGIINGHN